MMSSAAMKAVFDNLTSEAGRRAEQEYNTDSAANREAKAEHPDACNGLG